VLVGHATVLEPSRGVATGVSVVVPEGVEERALPAACHVINGYGKSVGLVQVDELGTLESPIVFTGVFAVPAVQEALLRRRLASDPAVGGAREGRSVNLVVLECNDARLNDPREHTCGEGELALALDSAAGGAVDQGTVGAGTGMTTFGLSGGFGTASRVFGVGAREYHLGVALVSNFGLWGDLTIGGRLVQTTEPVGRGEGAGEGAPDGSVVIVVATDAPFDSASLRGVCVRAQNGLARTGCVTAHGSGELVVAFSTERQSVREPEPQLLNEAFRAVAEAVEEAVLSGLAHAERVTGREGRSLPVLGDLTL
jgi:D-aminopeptidase